MRFALALDSIVMRNDVAAETGRKCLYTTATGGNAVERTTPGLSTHLMSSLISTFALVPEKICPGKTVGGSVFSTIVGGIFVPNRELKFATMLLKPSLLLGQVDGSY